MSKTKYILLIVINFLIFVILLTSAVIAPSHLTGSGEIGFGDSSLSGQGVPEETITSSSWDWQTSPIWEMSSEQILKFFDKIPEERFDELDDDELEDALEKKYGLQNVNVDLGTGTNNAQFEADSFYFDNALYLGIGTTVINNGINVKYKQGNLTAEHADSVIKDGSISTNVDDLNAGELLFFLGQADSLITDSITLKNIKNSTFKIDNKKVEIFSSDNYIVRITDKSSAKLDFNASEGSKLIITKTVPPYYNITNGSLSFTGSEGPFGEFTETIQTATNSSVYLNPALGFVCAELMPLSTYLYHSFDDERRDFAISIPQNSSQFRLCTRKDWVEKHDNNCNQCAIIDFISKKIDIHGYVSYLRHHVKGLAIMSNGLQLFHISLPNASASINLDSNFIFLPQLRVSYKEQRPEVSFTFTGKYHTIYERDVNGSMRRFLKTNFKLPEYELSDNLVYIYNSNHSDFDTAINANVVTQKVGSKVMVLPPNHPLIRKYLP